MHKEYIHNLLEIDEFHQETTSHLRFWYEYIRQNADIEGDILEFGVFRGSSLIAAALILKEIKSDKKVYGFDSFRGFPSYSRYDDSDNFYTYKNKLFSEDFLIEHEELMEIKKTLTNNEKLDVDTISPNGSFHQTSKEEVLRKIEYLKLDNIFLIEGEFKESVPIFFNKNNDLKIHSANIDCDLYDSYKSILPFIYKHLSVGGFVHLDEYYSLKYPGAKIACSEFFNENNIKPKKNKTRIGEFERWYFTKD